MAGLLGERVLSVRVGGNEDEEDVLEFKLEAGDEEDAGSVGSVSWTSETPSVLEGKEVGAGCVSGSWDERKGGRVRYLLSIFPS